MLKKSFGLILCTAAAVIAGTLMSVGPASAAGASTCGSGYDHKWTGYSNAGTSNHVVAVRLYKKNHSGDTDTFCAITDRIGAAQGNRDWTMVELFARAHGPERDNSGHTPDHKLVRWTTAKCVQAIGSIHYKGKDTWDESPYFC